MSRTDPQALDAACARLLAARPPVSVVAIARNGLFTAMPTAVPLDGHRVLEGATSMLDFVVEDDLMAVVDTWTRARRDGSAEVSVRLADGPELTVTLTYLDMTHAYGVHLGFLSGAEVVPVVRPRPQGAMRPRHAVARMDELAVVLDCDDAAPTMLGWARSELVGRKRLDYLHPADHPRAIAGWMDLLAAPGGARRLRLRHRRPDGSWMWLEVTNHNFLADPARGYVLSEMDDITEEMSVTEALRAEREVLRRLTDALPVGVVQLDHDARVVYRNGRAPVILGTELRAGERLNVPAADVDVAGAAGEVLTTGEDADVDVTLRPGPVAADPSGPERRLVVSLRALRAADDSVTGVIACVDDVTDAVLLREELARQADVDALTGCLSRRALLRGLQRLLAQHDHVTVLYVDLDDFKQVNDRYGHAAGDALLRHTAALLGAHARDDDLVGRLGGDEFLFVTTAPTGDPDVRRTVEDMARLLRTPVRVEGRRLVASASIGAARSMPGQDADDLVAAADRGMYRAKTGRHRAPHQRRRPDPVTTDRPSGD